MNVHRGTLNIRNMWSPKLKFQYWYFLVSDVRIGEAQQNLVQSSTCAKKLHEFMSRKSRLNVSVDVYYPWLCFGLGGCLFGNHSAIRMSGSTFQPLRCLGTDTFSSQPISVLQLLGSPDLHWASTGFHLQFTTDVKHPWLILCYSKGCACWRAPGSSPGSTAVPLGLHGWMDRSSWFS